MSSSTCQGPAVTNHALSSPGLSSSPAHHLGCHFSTSPSLSILTKPRHQQPQMDLRCTFVAMSPAPSVPIFCCCTYSGSDASHYLPSLGLLIDPITWPGSAQYGQTLRDGAHWRGCWLPQGHLESQFLITLGAGSPCCNLAPLFPVSKLLFVPFSATSYVVVNSLLFPQTSCTILSDMNLC